MSDRVYSYKADSRRVFELLGLPIVSHPSPFQLWQHHIREKPDALAALIPSDDCTDLIAVTRREFDELTNKAVFELFAKEGALLRDLKPGNFVGLMLDDQLLTLIITTALLKMDYDILLMTTKQSRVSVENLFNKTKAVCLITSDRHETRLQADQSSTSALNIRVPTFTPQTLLDAPKQPPPTNIPKSDKPDDLNRVRFCLHSSGSTSLPHPIYQDSRKVIADVAASYNTLCLHQDNDVRLVIGPLAHQMGFGAILAEFLVAGIPAVFALTKTFPGSPQEILTSMEKGKVTTLITVPSLLEDLIRYMGHDDSKWAPMKRLSRLSYGGAPIPKAVGDIIASKNFRVTTAMGSTEAGLVAYTTGLPIGKLDQNLIMSRTCSWRMQPLDDDDPEKAQSFELIILKDSPGLASCAVNTQEGFATEDVFVRGPTPDTWIYNGRKGDTLVHSNGEKTNTLILESAVEGDESIIRTCQIVGAGRNRCGILVDLEWSSEIASDLPKWDHTSFRNLVKTNEKMKALYEKVWKAVTQANAIAPGQSQIVKTMIYILPRGENLGRSDKGNLKRSVNTKRFEAEINSLYESKIDVHGPRGKLSREDLKDLIATQLSEVMNIPKSKFFDGSASPPSLFDMGMTSVHSSVMLELLRDKIGVTIPSSILYRLTTAEELLNYIDQDYLSQQSIAECISATVGTLQAEELLSKPDVPFADFGLTSVEAMAIRQSLQEITHKNDLPTDLLYQASTLTQLTQALQETALSEEQEIERQRQHAKQLNDKYTQMLKQLKPSQIKPTPDQQTRRVVMVTGASGHLGLHLVAQLCASKKVSKVVCLLRGGEKRLRETMETRRLSWDETFRETKLECLDFQTRDPQFGQNDETYKRLLGEVTDVLHNAWTVNFNLRVVDFEKDWLSSTYELLRFCCHEGYPTKTFGLTSSVSAIAAARFESNFIPEKFYGDEQLSMALNMGYGQSKYIAESMSSQARESLGINAQVFRCGQISGDTKVGVWKEEELVPMVIVNGGNDLGMIPEYMSMEDFIPVDVCAAAMVEILLSQNPGTMSADFVWHLQNPFGGTWQDWLDAFEKAGLKFKRVDAPTFLQAVKDSKASPLNKLISHLPGMMTKGSISHLDTSKTEAASLALANCPRVSKELARLTLDYWKSTQFYKAK